MAADPLLSNVALVQDVVREGGYNVKRICGAFGLRAADFAALTQRETESVARPVANDGFVRPVHEGTTRVLRELVQLLGLLRSMQMGNEAGTWLHTPLPSYAGRTPLELVREGKGQDLVARLLGLAMGDVGG